MLVTNVCKAKGNLDKFVLQKKVRKSLDESDTRRSADWGNFELVVGGFVPWHD